MFTLILSFIVIFDIWWSCGYSCLIINLLTGIWPSELFLSKQHVGRERTTEKEGKEKEKKKVIIIIIVLIIIIMALLRWHFHRVALQPPGRPTALHPCPRTVWRKKIT